MQATLAGGRVKVEVNKQAATKPLFLPSLPATVFLLTQLFLFNLYVYNSI